MSTPSEPIKAQPVFLAISAYLVAKCLWRVFIPGGSWPLPPWHILSMASDILLLIVLMLMNWVTDTSGFDQKARRVRTAMFWGGTISGVVLVLIRFTGSAAWWTGHLVDGIFL
ncbi:hypothetical protein LXM94_23985 [Rhizobium sp. TRM95111]|uniref:hypothetical protein n=1 Tax=Rhizobium alarense TaxID=2846851 RepID=UPI001F3898AC|nr:hypothetical protein [Rhizobium alarense]MCF3643025.1 hypothetical protein [Rhizobium alarense]